MTKIVYSSAKDIIVTEDGLTLEVSARATMCIEDGLDINLSINKVYVTIADKKSTDITTTLDKESLELIKQELYETYEEYITYGTEKDSDRFNGGAKKDYLCVN